MQSRVPIFRHNPTARSVGFTLLEMMVAMGVFAILIMLLASTANQVSKAWRDVESENQRRSVARALLHFMARELQTAAMPVPMPAASGSTANLQFIANLSVNSANPSAIPANLLHPHAIFWQAPVANNTSRGEITEVGYFIRWDTSQPGRAKAQLCRFFVEPTDTTNYLVYTKSGTNAVNWLASVNTAAPATPPAYKGWLSDNVIALWIRCLDTDGSPITQNAAGQTLNNGYGFDSRQGYREPSTGRIHPPPALPPCVQISLVVVDSHTAAKMATPVSPTATTPASFDKDAATSGSIQNFVNSLPAEIRSGTRVYSTTVFLSTTNIIP